MELASSAFKNMNSVSHKNAKKKTWKEMRQVVRQVRRQLSSTSVKDPCMFVFKHGFDDKNVPYTRIYCLSTLTSGRETTLLFTDINYGDLGDGKTVFPWQPLLESTFQVVHPLGRFSREEQLQWERKRLVMWGITSYDHHEEASRFVFPAGGSVFYCDAGNQVIPPLFPRELNSSITGAKLNPQMCPSNPDLVAYVYNCDLWVHQLASSCELRLTFCRKGYGDLSVDPISAGIPCYVTQEEFSRYTGYWWQPVCAQGVGVYRILYEEVDESDVEILHLPPSDDRGVEKFRFPRSFYFVTGTPNAKSTLKMIQFTLSANRQIENVTYLVMKESLLNLCPAFEYLVRAGWTPDGVHVWAQVLDRSQKHLQLILIPLSNFIPMDHMDDISSNHVVQAPLMQLICEEYSDVWINVHDILHFFPQLIDDEITFLWASEESGYRHLYIITVELLREDFTGNVTDPAILRPETQVSSRMLKKIALTDGDWEVSEKDVWVDEENELVYFIGLKDTPLERHLYVVSMKHPKDVIRLTTPGFSHNVAMDRDCSMFVSIQSNITQVPFGLVYQILHNSQELSTRPLGYILEHMSMDPEYPPPKLFTHQLQCGEVVYGMIFKPLHMVTGRKYPTILIIYGGPEVQLVTNTFKGMRHLRQHVLAAEGYVVVAVDCRGSRHRGVAFESHIKGKMGTVEVADQVEVLQWLAENTGYIDINRVAVHGWSYGGYLSLMALAQRPDIFKIAIAGAPVTSWRLYDTGYTERYMDTPENNLKGYSEGSVMSYVDQFPNEENHLLIIHGLMDENVHFSHTTQLVNSLVKAGKPYHLQVYPTERHSLRHLDASEHYETNLLSFLQQYL
ncbi:dipeptidyl peptidase 9-like [Tachypleus tridentatus]|uniref:dipeptidyl peptidase 9-like n=1 Tax=Tachypleus tridentatus TaxID=6853 RepID=UPI003FD1A152